MVCPHLFRFRGVVGYIVQDHEFLERNNVQRIYDRNSVTSIFCAAKRDCTVIIISRQSIDRSMWYDVNNYRRSQDVSVQTASNSSHRQAARGQRRTRTSGRPQRPGKPRFFAGRVRPAAAVLAVHRPAATAAGDAVAAEPRRLVGCRQRRPARRRRWCPGSDWRRSRPGVALQPGKSAEAVVNRGDRRTDGWHRTATVAGTASWRSSRAWWDVSVTLHRWKFVVEQWITLKFDEAA